jgi:hypothetical protein
MPPGPRWGQAVDLEGRPARLWAVVIAAAIAFSADALVSQWKRPVPEVFDEFGYLLQADTFAHGRMTNPPPPLAEAFESPYILVRPTYQAKYPPAQGLVLALGQRLFSRPVVGVWLGSACFAAALCWMLQAWLPPVWALWGTALAICQLACFGHWAQSYWGGMMTASGSALVFRALRRLIDSGNRRWFNAVVFAFGLVVLANTRPYEGLFTAVPVVAVLGICLWRSRRNSSRHAGETSSEVTSPARPASRAAFILSALLVLACGGALMAYYNQRVTHRFWTLPYQAYERQYDPAPIFFFQSVRPMPAGLNPAMQASAVDALQEVHWARHHFLESLTSKLFFFWQFAFGAVLGVPVMLALAAESRSWLWRSLPLAAYAAIQLAALQRFLFWPAPHRWLVIALLIALLLQYGLLFRLFSDRWERLALLTVGFVLVAILAESARFRTHYAAPLIPLTIFLVAGAMRRLVCGLQHRFRALPLAVGVPLLALASMAAASLAVPTPVRRWAQKRAQVESQLQKQPGKQLVLVKYKEGYDYYQEWVYNHADLDRAKVVWARDLGASADNELIDDFPDRQVWWLDAASANLQRHPPKEPNELPLLP